LKTNKAHSYLNVYRGIPGFQARKSLFFEELRGILKKYFDEVTHKGDIFPKSNSEMCNEGRMNSK
jgi:hypothetical protein